MSAEQPVIRTYRARERSEAEEAYRLDAETAEQQHWYPVAHRWSSSWAGEELSVVFEHRPDGGDGVAAPDGLSTSDAETVEAEPVETAAKPEENTVGAAEVVAAGAESPEETAEPAEAMAEPDEGAESAEHDAEPELEAIAEPTETPAAPDEAVAEAEPSIEAEPEAPSPEAGAVAETAEPWTEAAGTSAETSEPWTEAAETSADDEVWAPEPAAIEPEPDAMDAEPAPTEALADATEPDSSELTDAGAWYESANAEPVAAAEEEAVEPTEAATSEAEGWTEPAETPAEDVWAPEPAAVASEPDAIDAEPAPTEALADPTESQSTEAAEIGSWYGSATDEPAAAAEGEAVEPTEAATGEGEAVDLAEDEVWAPESAVAPEPGAAPPEAESQYETETVETWTEPAKKPTEDEVWAPEPAAVVAEAEAAEPEAVPAEAAAESEPTEAAAAEAEHEAQVEAEYEAQTSDEDEETEASGESLSAADDESPWTEYDSSPTDAPDDALAREEPWVASALVDEHEPGYMSVTATAVAALMHDDWATLPIEADESPESGGATEPESTAEPESEATAEPESEATAEPEPESTAEPEPEATDEPEPEAAAEPEPEAAAEPEPEAAAEPENLAAWIAAAHVTQAAPSSSVASTERSEPMSAAMPAVRTHARALVQAIDLHTAGEPLRLIRSGFPAVPSAPILERRAWLKDHLDFARQVLMWEPRGHRDMYGAILLPPYAEGADISVLFMHNEGYSTMCGHGIIAITTALIEEGLYPATTPETEIRFETPAGIVTATAPVARTDDGRHEVSSVRFQNVPSYLHERDIQVRPDGVQLAGDAAEHGLLVDIAFGGAYYGIVNAADLGLRVVPEQTDALTRAGAAITDVLRRDHTPTHPIEPDLGFVYGTIIVDDDPASSPDGRASGADLRNVTIFADAEVDRSPCGSGTSALLARLHGLGQLDTGTRITNAGITGEAFHAWVDSETQIGDRTAVLTSVEGHAYVTGYHTFVIDDRDPLGNGFLLR